MIITKNEKNKNLIKNKEDYIMQQFNKFDFIFEKYIATIFCYLLVNNDEDVFFIV